MAGIAEKLAAIEAAAATATGAGGEEMITGHLDADHLNEMTVKEPTALAGDMGLEVKKNMKKADLVAMIVAEPVQYPTAEVEEPAADFFVPNTEGDQMLDTETEQQPGPVVEMVKGRVLVTYTGMVNLRDGDLKVVGQAMQGQTFAATCKRVDDSGTWYMVEDQTGKPFFISADVVRLIN